MKRIISLLVMLAVLFSIPVSQAAEWVTVSSWAYTSVSNFKKEGLLPASFEEVEDYTADITRVQFAELMYSVLVKARCITDPYDHSEFTDTDNEAALQLSNFAIMEGEVTDTVRERISEGGGSMLRIVYSFFPDRILNREEMAAVIYRAVNRYSPSAFNSGVKVGGSPPSDYNEISTWARDSVTELYSIGLLEGMGGEFAPKSNLTIEQAITALYTLYNILPSISGADGANLPSVDFEIQVQKYDNGLTETRYGDTLYIKNGDEVLMEFEADIYINIYCITRKDGITYAAAVNFNGKTDVYNVETGGRLFQLPSVAAYMTEEYIITKPSNVIPYTYGVCDYNGNELIPPEYSLSEIDVIAANNYKEPYEAERAADGWIYYIASENKKFDSVGRIYKVDSNGENKQRLTDRYCFYLSYANGRIYYRVVDDDGRIQLYSIKTDGTDEKLVTENFCDFVPDGYQEWKSDTSDEYGFLAGMKFSDGEDMLEYENIAYSEEIYSYDGWMYFEELSDDEGIFSYICRFNETDGTVERVTDLKDNLQNITNVQTRKGKIYFKSNNYGGGYRIHEPLYCYDGKKITKIRDDVLQYGFMGDELVVLAGKTYEDSVAYISDLDGGNERVMQAIEDAKAMFRGGNERELVRLKGVFGDDKYSVYGLAEISPDNYAKYSTVYYDRLGNETKVDAYDYAEKRIGDTLYFSEFDDKLGKIIAYDMNTGLQSVVANNVKTIDYLTNPYGNAWMTYTDHSGNIWRINADNSVSEIYPCKGIYKYGDPECIIRLSDGLYKADKDGNFYKLIDDNVYGYIYVENGAVRGINYYLF